MRDPAASGFVHLDLCDSGFLLFFPPLAAGGVSRTATHREQQQNDH
jgi:hypothetical protein